MSMTPVCVKKKMRMHTRRVQSQERPSTIDLTVPSPSSSEGNVFSKLSTKPTPDSGKHSHGMMELPDDIWDDLVMANADIVGYQIDSSTDDLEPIPYSALFAGAPIEVDNVSSPGLLSPFGMTHDEYLSAKFYENFQHAPPIRRSPRGKKLTLPEKQPRAPQHTFTCENASFTSVKPTQKRQKTKHSNEDGPSQCKKRRIVAESMDEARVGPDSWQMKKLYRMIIYLEETEGSENAQHAKIFRAVVAQCDAFHRSGNAKYLHLPGAIFEEMVDRIGGPAFLQIWNESKTFEHPRLDDVFPKNEIVVVGPHATVRVIDVTDGQPNLLQVSVAYGFNLANTMDSNDRGASIQEVLERGAHSVLNFDETARQSFWASQIACDNQDPDNL